MAGLAVEDEHGGELDEAEGGLRALLPAGKRTRRKRLNRLRPTPTTQRRGGWGSGCPRRRAAGGPSRQATRHDTFRIASQPPR